MFQQGQVFELKSDGHMRWAYRYRVGGRGSQRVQRGGFQSEGAATEALERALERLRRERGLIEAPHFGDLVDVYLSQHGGEPETVEKLRWLLAKAVRAFGDRRINYLQPAEIAAWRMTIPSGHRFEATQAVRQVLARAVSWGLIDVNPAKQGIDNPQRRRTEKRPFESWDELDAVAAELGPRLGSIVLFAAATGLRRRAWRNGRLKCPKTEASVRAVPPQAVALAALDQLHGDSRSPLVFHTSCGGYIDLHNFHTRNWKPAQIATGIQPLRRIYDLGHTFATFALRAGISTFELSRYMGTSIGMIDRHYGHLARDGREHAIQLLDAFSTDAAPTSTAWTPGGRQSSKLSPSGRR